MAIDLETLVQILKSPHETRNLEFKEAKNTYSREKLFEYCIALANEGGGNLILGISDSYPRTIVGSFAFENVSDIERQIFQKLNISVPVTVLEIDLQRVVVFEVPSRPKGCPLEIDGKYLMRAGDALVAMSPDRLRTIFDEGKENWLSEPATAPVEPQTIIDLLDTQSFFDRLELPYPPTREGVIEKLLLEGLISRLGSSFVIRKLGAVLLAKKFSDFADFKTKVPRVIVYEDTTKLRTKIDQSATMGFASGFPRLVDFVMSQLPQNEAIKGAIRETDRLLPKEAIRELVANALIHQDFSIGGIRTTIEIYSDRIEISNPGTPLSPVSRFIDQYQTRNEALADIMRRMRFCEEKGSGVDRVVDSAERFQLPAPNFLSDGQRTIAIVLGPRKFEEMTRDDKIRAIYQHCVLKYVGRSQMTNETLRARFGLPASKSSTISALIAAAVEDGFIRNDVSVGESRKYARYLPSWA
jgi:ATP-dependent DNA helicase RecG